MVVDHERVLARLKEEVADRQGIGIDSLFALLARLEVECRTEEGLPERAFRLYGVALSRDLIQSGVQPAPPVAQALSADGDDDPPYREPNGSKEEVHGGFGTEAAGSVA